MSWLAVAHRLADSGVSVARGPSDEVGGKRVEALRRYLSEHAETDLADVPISPTLMSWPPFPASAARGSTLSTSQHPRAMPCSGSASSAGACRTPSPAPSAGCSTWSPRADRLGLAPPWSASCPISGPGSPSLCCSAGSIPTPCSGRARPSSLAASPATPAATIPTAGHSSMHSSMAFAKPPETHAPSGAAHPAPPCRLHRTAGRDRRRGRRRPRADESARRPRAQDQRASHRTAARRWRSRRLAGACVPSVSRRCSRASRPPSRRSSPRPDNAAGCTSCATCWRTPARAAAASSPPSWAPPSRRTTPGPRASNGAGSPTSCGPKYRNSPSSLQGLLALSPPEIGRKTSWPCMDEAEPDVLAYMTGPARPGPAPHQVALDQSDRAPHRSRRHLPQRGRHHQARRRPAARAERRMGGPEIALHDPREHRPDRR